CRFARLSHWFEESIRRPNGTGGSRSDPKSVLPIDHSGTVIPMSSGGERQLDEAALFGRVVDALRRLAVVALLGVEDVLHKRLWVTVVEREPARLDLDHDPVPGSKHMVGRRQGKAVQEWRVRRDRLGLGVAFSVSATENVAVYHELVARHA